MGAQVLLVDDDELLLDVLATVFDLEEFDVRCASSGADALEAVAQQRPAVVVCDAVMPGIDGYEVCRRLKQDPATASLPVVLLTSGVDGSEAQAEPQAACDASLDKPFSALELLDMVRGLVGSRSTRIRPTGARPGGGGG